MPQGTAELRGRARCAGCQWLQSLLPPVPKSLGREVGQVAFITPRLFLDPANENKSVLPPQQSDFPSPSRAPRALDKKIPFVGGEGEEVKINLMQCLRLSQAQGMKQGAAEPLTPGQPKINPLAGPGIPLLTALPAGALRFCPIFFPPNFFLFSIISPKIFLIYLFIFP